VKVKALKSGTWANPVVSQPHLKIEEGKDYDVDALMCDRLCDCGAVKKVSIAEKVVEKVVKKVTKKKKK